MLLLFPKIQLCCSLSQVCYHLSRYSWDNGHRNLNALRLRKSVFVPMISKMWDGLNAIIHFLRCWGILALVIILNHRRSLGVGNYPLKSLVSPPRISLLASLRTTTKPSPFGVISLVLQKNASNAWVQMIISGFLALLVPVVLVRKFIMIFTQNAVKIILI